MGRIPKKMLSFLTQMGPKVDFDPNGYIDMAPMQWNMKYLMKSQKAVYKSSKVLCNPPKID